MKRRRNLWGLAAVLVAALAFCGAASAHQSPAGCTGDGLEVSFSTVPELDGYYRIGDELKFRAVFSNDGPNACDVSDLDIVIQLPGKDGAPGRKMNVATGVDVPAGLADFQTIATADYTVDLAENLFRAPVSLSYEATVHSGSPDGAAEGTIDSGVWVTRPQSVLKVSTDVSQGPPPLTVTYTYDLTNTSPSAPLFPTPPPLELVPTPAIVSTNPFDDKDLIEDGNCAPVTYVSGNLGNESPASLDPGIDGLSTPETWRFQCTRTYESPGSFSSLVKVKGNSNVDKREWPSNAQVTDGVDVLGSDLTVDKSHEGDFIEGGTGRYTIKVSNNGNLPTSGLVSVSDQLPKGLKATAIAGQGWDCDLGSLVCSRSDELYSGGSYPDVTLDVKVGKSPPANVINRATVSNEAEYAGSNNTDEDPTRIRVPGKPEALPSNRFNVKWARVKADGSIAIRVKVPGPGLVVADDYRRKSDLFMNTIRRARKKGQHTLTVRPTSLLTKRLAKTKKPVRGYIKLAFTPKGGLTAARKLKIMVSLG